MNTQNTHKKHHGVVVPMATPFTPAGNLDEDATRRVIDFILDGGVAGVFVLGTTGEAVSVPRAARLRLVELTVKHVNGRALVYSGMTDNCLADTVEAGNRYLQAGIDAAVAMLPSYYPIEPPEMLRYFGDLLDRIEGPTILYNIPPTTHLSIPLDVLEKLIGHPRLVGVKDSENDLQRQTELLRRFGGRENFSIFVGTGALMAKMMLLGADGIVPGFGNLVPGLCHQLYVEARQGNRAKVEQLDKTMMEAAKFWQHGRTLGQSLAALKAAMSLQGLCQPTVLSPLLTLKNGESEVLRKEMLRLGILK